MNNGKIQIGIDHRRDMFYAARVDNSVGRPDVKALLRFEKKHLNNHKLLKGGELVLSLDDNLVQLQKLSLNTDDPEYFAKAEFELSQSLLDEGNNYIFDTHETSAVNRSLGLAVKKESLEAILDEIGYDSSQFESSPSYLMRSIALGRGYLTFCQKSGGDLIALVDINQPMVMITFIYKGKILDIATFSIDQLNLSNDEDLKRFNIELRTLLNFKSESFIDEGISLPVSALIVCGLDKNSNLFDRMKNELNMPLIRPCLNPAFFAKASETDEIPLENYLVALGLAVK